LIEINCGTRDANSTRPRWMRPERLLRQQQRE
jgi:hypothetical protein